MDPSTDMAYLHYIRSSIKNEDSENSFSVQYPNSKHFLIFKISENFMVSRFIEGAFGNLCPEITGWGP